MRFFFKLRIYILSFVFHVAIKLVGFGKLKNFLEYFIKERVVNISVDEAQLLRDHTRRIFNKIRKSKKYLGNCLSTTLVLWFILQRQGVFSKIVIGVKKQSTLLKAHAWLEIEGVPLNARLSICNNYAILGYDLRQTI